MGKRPAWPTFDGFLRWLLSLVGVGRGRDEFVTRMLARGVAENRDVALLCEAFSRDSWHWREPALRVLAARISEGVPLDQAVGESPRALPPETRFAVGLGSQTDTLPETLDLAAHVLSDNTSASRIDLQNQVYYFATLLFTMVNITSFIMYYIIPKFKRIFEGFGVQLPGATVALIHVSDHFTDYFYVYVICAGILIRYLRMERTRFWGQGRFPLLLSSGGRTRRATPNLLRLLAIAAERGVPWERYLDKLIEQPLPSWLRRSLTKVTIEIENGHKPWPSLAKYGWLNAWEVSALEQSERAGNTIWTLRELANTRELRSQYHRASLDELLKPLAVLMIAGLVGFVVIALFMPIVKMIVDLT